MSFIPYSGVCEEGHLYDTDPPIAELNPETDSEDDSEESSEENIDSSEENEDDSENDSLAASDIDESDTIKIVGETGKEEL